jgi:hypothetical protein
MPVKVRSSQINESGKRENGQFRGIFLSNFVPKVLVKIK